MSVFFSKLKEGFISIVPIYLLVIILNLTPFIDLIAKEVIVFSVTSIIASIGIAFFNMGADSAISPMGRLVGSAITKKGSIVLLLFVSFFLGFLVTIAEPNLQVLGIQIKELISPLLVTLTISIGVGIFVIVSILRIIFKIDLSKILMFLYTLVFGLTFFVLLNNNEILLALAFDSGGVTTGPLTVPFMMAICIGISSVISKKSEKEMKFGLIGLSSVGSIILVLILSLFIKNPNTNFEINGYLLAHNIAYSLMISFFTSLKDIFISLLVLSVVFLIINKLFLHLSKENLLKIGIGILYTLIGLNLFLCAVNTGFMPLGYKLGLELANNHLSVILIVSFIIGMLSVIAEPAIHVLNKQVEEITGGIVKKRVMLINLMVGVGISLLLSMLRIYFDFNIMYFLVPGFIIALILSFFVPKVYTAIAFDSGGVAAGALTSSFMLPLAVGACIVFQGNNKVFEDAFGIVSMVALTPVIMIELVGLISLIKERLNTKKEFYKISQKEDEVIIKF